MQSKPISKSCACLRGFHLMMKQKEIHIYSVSESNNQVDIVPKSNEITIMLDEQTKPSITSAKGTITLENPENKPIYLSQITPQSNNFILIPKVPIKINEVDFLGENVMKIQTNNNNNNVEIEKIKVQSHSVGTINNAIVKEIVFGPSSNLNIVGNVDMSDSIVDLSYNDNLFNANAIFSGELNSIPKSIFFNKRDFVYLDEADRFLIAESESSNFDCDEWAKSFRKGPFDSKFNDAECKEENNSKRLYAFVNHKKQDDNGNGLKGGEIAGIVIGVVIVVAAVVGCLVYIFVFKKKKYAESSEQVQIKKTLIGEF